MASSLFSNSNTNTSNRNIIQQFAEFKRTMQGKDPEQIVKQMLASGQMSQQQFESLKQQVQSYMSILR